MLTQTITKPHQPLFQAEDQGWLDTFFYDNRIVRNFAYATLFWV